MSERVNIPPHPSHSQSLHAPGYSSVGSSTELKNSDFVGVDLLGGLEESPRKYTLRALGVGVGDGGEESPLKEWSDPPPQSSHDALHHILSSEQIQRTLEYFLLCSERVGQMTKTYNDVDAVTQLLEEKEKDLELAAKIGQSLLEQNRELQQRNEFLEEQFSATNDRVTQLKHELSQKIDLLHIYTDSESEAGGGATSPSHQSPPSDSILKKVKLLEDENSGLKLEASHLRCLTQGLEEKEQQLVHDCVKQLEEANRRVKLLHFEIAEKSEECSLHQGEVSKLLKDLVEAQKNERKAGFENEDLTLQLHAAQEAQAELATEVLELQERYAEVMAMLHEAQEELSYYRKSAVLPGRGGSPLADSMYDSLQSELEASDSGFYSTPLASARSADEHLRKSDVHIQRTMKTVKEALEKASLFDGKSLSPTQLETIPDDPDISSLQLPEDQESERCRTPSPLRLAESAGDPLSSREDSPQSTRGSIEEKRLSPKAGNYSGGKLSHAPSTDSLASYAGPALGEPGMPGTRDLEFAIRRLSMRRKVEMDYQKFRQAKGYAPSSSTSRLVPPPSATKAPVTVSLTEGGKSSTAVCGPRFYKSLEGSRTLKQWRMLATPSLFGAINSVHTLPGVRMRTSFYEHLRCSTPVSMSMDRDSTPTADSGFSTELDDSSAPESSSGAHAPTPGTFSFVTSQIPYPVSSTSVRSPTAQRLRSMAEVTPTPSRVRTYSGNSATSLVWSSNAKSVMTTQSDEEKGIGLNVVASASGGEPGCDMKTSGILTRAELQSSGIRGAKKSVSHYLATD